MFLKVSCESICKGFSHLGEQFGSSSNDETLVPRDSAIQGPGVHFREALTRVHKETRAEKLFLAPWRTGATCCLSERDGWNAMAVDGELGPEY